ncbi:MAG: sn-glycerol-3-phosphate ABC transporter ATP-binding protein UgpC [Pseudomonadota bacterium]
MTTLAVQDVKKDFGATKVLKDIDMEIGTGDFLVLVGPSGCGKSTLLNIIAGLEKQTSGEILIAGKDVSHLEPKERDIAMVFQSYALYPSMTVERNIGFSLEMAGVDKATRKQRIQEVAELLKIEELLNRRPSQLSGGQRQRVAMGRALVREPQIFLFDEPLSNLDAKLRVDMRVEIKKLHQRLGATIVYVTHDQIEAMTMATKIAVMKGGIIQQFGAPKDIYDRPSNTFVATFMGSPAMNLIDGTLVTSGTGLAVKAGEETIPVPGHIAADGLSEGQSVQLGLRPEAVHLESEVAHDTRLADGWVFDRVIEVTEPTGPATLALFEMGGEEFHASLSGDAEVEAGQSYRFKADLSKALLFDSQSGDRLPHSDEVPQSPKTQAA